MGTMAGDLKKLEHPDNFHLSAAEGWLDLGDWQEANAELENISAPLRAHPAVLHVRWGVYAAAENWQGAVEVARATAEKLPDLPYGWIHWAYALNELKRTAEARDVLLPVVDKFPDEYMFRYNLECYACRLGELAGALQ